MENKNIIVILVVIIFILVAAIGMVLFNPITAKEPTRLKIIGNNSLTEGDNLSIQLMDLNETPLSNQRINVSIMDEGGSINYKSVVTDENGKATLKINKDSGKFSINCTFEGNDRYANSSAFKKIEIKNEEKVEETVSYQSESYSESYSSQSSSEDYRPAVDSGGITREEADYWGWEYTTDHGGHYIGSRDHWDEKAGMYHD